MALNWVSPLGSTIFAAALFVAPLDSAARAADLATVEVVLQNDTFAPAEIAVPAGTPFMLKVTNKDAAPAEIEGKELKVEKVVAGNSENTARVRALEPGRYLLVNEYKEDTVKAYVVAK